MKTLIDPKVKIARGETSEYLQQVIRPFLVRFGHSVPCSDGDREFCEHIAGALESYQKFHHLAITGVLDPATLEDMAKPRCGLPDRVPAGAPQAVSAFVARGKWPKTHLKYYFVSGTADIAGDTERPAIQDAFGKWGAVTPLTFEEVTTESASDIAIGWVTADHGDGFPFDGPGRVLAHAFYPGSNTTGTRAGDVHFDDDEKYSLNGIIDIDLPTVALHEFGHALGLDHTDKLNAVMYPSYLGRRRNLTRDDVEGIQSLYGAASGPLPPCFLALVTDGTALQAHADQLRRFREVEVKASRMGRRLLAGVHRVYYAFSPAVVRRLRNRRGAQRAVRNVIARPLIALLAAGERLTRRIPGAGVRTAAMVIVSTGLTGLGLWALTWAGSVGLQILFR